MYNLRLIFHFVVYLATIKWDQFLPSVSNWLSNLSWLEFWGETFSADVEKVVKSQPSAFSNHWKKWIRDQTPPHCGDTTGAYFAIILFWTPDHPATFRNEIIKNIQAFPKVPIALKTLKKMQKSCGAQLMEVPLVKHRETNRKSVDTWLIELPML